MDKSELLLKCYSNHKKRRLLNILMYYPMTHSDLVKVTKINKDRIVDYLKEFEEAGIIKKKLISHKLRIYLSWQHDTKFTVEDFNLDNLDERKIIPAEGRQQSKWVSDEIKKKYKDKPIPFPKRIIHQITKYVCW